ncbi:19227_t:CDS:1, partial [Funneliformis geosporum]
QLSNMDIQQYFEIQQYLNHNKYPDYVQSNQKKKRFVNMTKYFIIQNSNLNQYDRRRAGHLLQVLK